MKNGNTFNSAPDTGKSFEDAYGSWDTLQEELAQQKQAKAEAEAIKKREEELAKGAKKFDKSVRDAIHKGDKIAFNENDAIEKYKIFPIKNKYNKIFVLLLSK